MLGGSHGEAVRVLEASVELHPDELPLVHLLARVLATAPEAEVRDGERALEIAQRVFATQQSIEHAETIAMALAETGRFADAVAWQRDLVTRARSRLAPGAVAELEARLAQYERGEPVRAPWRE